MTVSDVLSKAADVIEQRGLNKGWYVDRDGRVCTTGAMYVAVGMPPDYPASYQASSPNVHLRDVVSEARDAFRKYVDDGTVEWNDQPGRTADQVVRALRGAAVKYAVPSG